MQKSQVNLPPTNPKGTKKEIIRTNILDEILEKGSKSHFRELD